MARQQPLDNPQWAAPIIRRLAWTAGLAALGAYALGLVLAIVVTDREAIDPLVQAIAALAAIVASVVVAGWLARTRVAPLYEIIGWSAAVATARWAELGLGNAIPDPEGALEALAGRDDEPAVAARTTLLAGLGRADDLDAALSAWDPRSPLAVATIARHRATLDALRGGAGDPGLALAAASAIPDEPDRVRTLALIHLDAAIRAARAGHRPEPELRAARRELDGQTEIPVGHAGREVLVLAAGLTMIGTAIPVAVACVVAGGIWALAVWVVLVAAFVLGLRVYSARRRRTAPPRWRSGGGRDPELPAGSGRR